MTNPDLPRAPTCVESEATPPQTSEQPPQPQEQGRPLRLGPVLSWLHRTFRDVWFYVAAVSLVMNIVHTFRPQLSIEIGATIPNQPASTLFTLANTGSWTLHNITLKCSIWTGHRWIVSEGNIVTSSPTSAMAGNPEIRSLSPAEIATRDCAVPPFISVPANESIRIDVSSKFDWFFARGSEIRHFDMRSFGGNLILVHDVEFRPDLPRPPSY
jgi:hypothetical protein